MGWVQPLQQHMVAVELLQQRRLGPVVEVRVVVDLQPRLGPVVEVRCLEAPLVEPSSCSSAFLVACCLY